MSASMPELRKGNNNELPPVPDPGPMPEEARRRMEENQNKPTPQAFKSPYEAPPKGPKALPGPTGKTIPAFAEMNQGTVTF